MSAKTNKTPNKKRWLLGLAVALICTLQAYPVEYLCRKVSLDEGLSHSNVTAITRDGRGFMWIGTRFGLNRYDFEHTVNYYHDPSDSTSLPGNSIVALHTDSRGRIWVATEDGIAYQCPYRDCFKPLIYNGKPLEGRCFIDEKDGLLIGGIGTVMFYDFNSGSLTRLQTKGGSTYAYRAILRRSPDSYVMATRWDGLWLFDRTHATISRMPGVEDKHIMASTIDSNGVLYYSPYGEGFRACDRAGTPLFAYTTANSPLKSNIVLDLKEHEGRIWIATDGGGITIFNPATGKFERESGQKALDKLGSVTTLYKDIHGNIYAGTVREGAIGILSSIMRTIQPSGGANFSGLAAIYRDSEERTWVGDDGKGVMLYDPDSDSFTSVPETANLKVTDIVEHDPSSLLVATFAHGYFLLDKKTLRLRPAPEVLNRYWNEMHNRAIPVHLRTLAPNAIAIVTDRIDTYNPLDGRLYTSGQMPPTGPLIPFFNRAGRLLCFGNGAIVDFDPVTGKTAEIFRAPADDYIHSAAYDGYNTIYMAMDNGVTLLNTSTGATSLLTHLPERVSSMICEPDGRLWIATTRAIHLHRPGQPTLATFGLNDGVVPNEYIPNAVLCTEGRVLFGGSYGLLRIQADEVDAMMASQPDPDLNLADIRIDGISAYSSIQNGELDIPDRFSTVILSVIDNGPDSQRRTHFRFTVRGGGHERVTETDSRTVDLSFLDPGESYIVELSSLRPDGSWTRPHPLVHLAVMAPWFKSPWMWAAALLMLFLMAALWDLRQRRVRRERMARELENYRHNALEREIAFLVNTNYALRTPLTLIYAPLKLTLERLRRGEQDELIPELERVYNNTKKMRDTIDMALEIHQVNAKHNMDNLVTHDLSRSIKDVLGTLTAEAETKHLTCAYMPTQEMFPALYDRERIGTVLDIFLRNAIQRSSEYASVEVRATLRDGLIRVTVTDTGDTLDAEMLPQLFSKYFHDEESMFDNSIGFAYAKNIVELHAGTVGAENNPDGTGLSVWFEIPAAGQSAVEAYTRRRRNEALEPPKEIEPLVSGVDTSAMSALVVEADNDLCLFISGQLGDHFHKVYHAFNGKDALLMVKQYQPDIVISSLRLPGMSGLELCQALKSSPDTSHIPVILLTALKEGSTLENAYEAGADSYLAKPFDLNILMARCRNLLHTRSVIRQRYADLPSKTDHPVRPVTNADETFLLKINKIINDNLSNPDFGVVTLVDMMATSRSALYTKFKEVTGQTMGAYISDMRLRKAKQLLTETDMTVNEISDMLGFNSQRYFSTFFKDRAGKTPSAYRANPTDIIQ